MGYTNNQDLCLRCAPLDQKSTAVESHLKKEELSYYATELEKVKRKRITINKGVPTAASQAFSLALNYCHLAEVEAKTDRDLWKAKIQLSKLKAICVVDLMGGKKTNKLRW